MLIKHVVDNVKLSNWGLTYYNNFLALVMFPLGFIATGDFNKKLEFNNTNSVVRRRTQAWCCILYDLA